MFAFVWRPSSPAALLAAFSVACLSACLIFACAVAAQAEGDGLAADPPRSSSYAPVASSSERGDAKKTRRLREGSRVDNVIGFFRLNGDGATLITEDEMELGGLPNLNLERVVKMLKSVDEPEAVYWSVSGEVTEFSGRNYLLISRAVFKAAAPPPAPEIITD